MKRDPKAIAEAIMRKAGVPTGYVASSDLLAEAERWVSGLAVGDHVTDATDGDALGKFAHLLPMLLRARGLDTDEEAPGVWLVVERIRPGLIYDNVRALRGHPGNFVVSKRTVWA